MSNIFVHTGLNRCFTQFLHWHFFPNLPKTIQFINDDDPCFNLNLNTATSQIGGFSQNPLYEEGIAANCGTLLTINDLDQMPSGLSDIEFKDSVTLAIGPEGDFSSSEIESLVKEDYIPVSMGSRILRAETAVISAISTIRALAGEF